MNSQNSSTVGRNEWQISADGAAVYPEGWQDRLDPQTTAIMYTFLSHLSDPHGLVKPFVKGWLGAELPMLCNTLEFLSHATDQLGAHARSHGVRLEQLPCELLSKTLQTGYVQYLKESCCHYPGATTFCHDCVSGSCLICSRNLPLLEFKTTSSLGGPRLNLQSNVAKLDSLLSSADLGPRPAGWRET